MKRLDYPSFGEILPRMVVRTVGMVRREPRRDRWAGRVKCENETLSDFQLLRVPFLDSPVALVVAYRLFSSGIPTG